MSAPPLPRATPAEAGVDPRAIASFLDHAAEQGIELHGLMICRHGAVIVEGWWSPYRADLPHMQHSLAKSVTATAIGLALAEKRIALRDTVVSFFPDLLPPDVGDNLAAMTIDDLLTMRSGHRTGISGAAWRVLDANWAAAFLATEVPDRPSTRFVYSSASSYMLSAILQRATGERMRDYLAPRLFAPLGIAGVEWDLSPGGVNPGGNGLSWPLEASLKLGLLHLQDGIWNGTRILPTDWVRAATTPTSSPAHAEDPAAARHLAERAPLRGYGRHWWSWADDAYLASGLFGQYAVVLPRQESVIAVTAAMPVGDERLLDLIWRDLRPALAGVPDAGPTPDLGARFGSLAVSAPVASEASPRADWFSRRRYVFAPNPHGVVAVTLQFEADGGRFVLEDAAAAHEIAFGLGQAVETVTTMPGASLHHGYDGKMRVLAHGCWVDDATFAMSWQFIKTAFRDTVICRFEGDRLTLERQVNVNSAALAWAPLVSRAMGAETLALRPTEI